MIFWLLPVALGYENSLSFTYKKLMFLRNTIVTLQYLHSISFAYLYPNKMVNSTHETVHIPQILLEQNTCMLQYILDQNIKKHSHSQEKKNTHKLCHKNYPKILREKINESEQTSDNSNIINKILTTQHVVHYQQTYT